MADRDLPFLRTATAPLTGRPLELSLVSKGGAPFWGHGELISDQRLPGGGVNFQIERGEEGYRFWGPEYGTHLVAADGTRIWGIAGEGRLDAWQRLLVAQALPFAAVLQGLEVLHASAVAQEGAAIVFGGGSGSGKTSLAQALAGRGAEFLADDVLALERTGDDLLGHPGAPVAGVDHGASPGAGEKRDREDSEVLAINDRERIERVALRSGPAPLRAFFLIERKEDGPDEPRFEPIADPRILLSATFNLLLATPQRLESLLDVCAWLAEHGSERVSVGTGVSVESLADALSARVAAAV